MSVQIRIDDSSVQRELTRLADGPDQPDYLRLDAHHTRLFLATYDATHHITYNLRQSGKVNTEARANVWRGEIQYGGGPKNVDYAWFEARRGYAPNDWRGGSHDYMRATRTPEAHQGYVEAIISFMDRGVA